MTRFAARVIVITVLVSTGLFARAQKEDPKPKAAQASPPVNSPAAPPPASSASASPTTSTSSDDAMATSLGIALDPFDYDSRGRRDPFSPPTVDKPLAPGSMHGPLLALQRYELSQLSLVGIIWDVRRPKAMLKDPSGNVHIVAPNTKIGPRNGYIAVIREGEMVVVETNDQEGRLVSTAQVVKIAK